jgi:hypothetical protein
MNAPAETEMWGGGALQESPPHDVQFLLQRPLCFDLQETPATVFCAQAIAGIDRTKNGALNVTHKLQPIMGLQRCHLPSLVALDH